MIPNIIPVLSKAERIALFVAAVTLFVSGSIVASFYYLDSTTVAEARGGEYREGVVGQPVFINPVIPVTEADRDMSRLIFGSLYDIATSIKRSEDGKTWNVRIQEGWKWHDGKNITSDDVIFTLGIIQNKDARSYLYSSFQGVEAERISELEIKFRLQAPYAFFEDEHIKTLMVIPKHIFGDSEVQNLRFSKFGLNPIGFGPYKAVDFEHDDRGVIQTFRLIKNDDYGNLPAGRTDGQTKKPNIAGFIFKFFHTEKELVSAYNSGQIDGFGLNSAENLVVSTDSKFKGKDAINIRHNVHELKSSRHYAIFINQGLGGKELKNIKGREALSRSVDRQLLVKEALGSYGSVIYGPTVLTMEKSGSYDPLLLNGLELAIVVPDESFLVKTAEIVKTTWERLGAKVELSVLPLKAVQEDILRNTNYEMLMFGNIAGASNDLFSFWHSSRRFYPDQNLSLFQNKKVDAMLEAFRKDFDETTRTERLRALSDAIAAEHPAVFLYSPDYVYISTPNLGGFSDLKIVNNSSDRFLDIVSWHLKTKRVWK